jgi:L,D-peptidoglycan transpeptidase YkuD (ErfK/YbiS/YcfS/YnhG family)
MESKSLNRPEGVYYLLEAWRNNYQSGNVLTETSIYREDLSWSAENAKINYDIVSELIKRKNQKNPT